MKPSVLFLIPLLAIVPAAEAAPLTLAQAIDTALAHYPTVEAARDAIDAARGRTEQSGAARLPQVSADGTYQYTSLRPYVNFALPSGPSSFYEGVQNSYNATVSLRQLLTDFGKTDALVAAARAGELSAQDALEQSQHELGYRTIQAFYRVLLLRQAADVAGEDIRALDEALRISQRKFSGGTATKFDVLTTQVRLANARNSRTDTLAALRKAEASLRQLLGWSEDTPLDLAGNFDQTVPVPGQAVAMAEGLKNRPEARIAHDSESMADSKLAAADRDNRPVLAAQAVGGMQNGDLPALYANKGYVDAGLSVSLPLFTGNRITGERIEAHADLRAAQARMDEIGRDISTEIQDAYADLDAARERLDSADALVSQSEEALALARTRYANGVITNFELLDAQSAARGAELTRLQARYDCALAAESAAEAAGRPPAAP